MAKPVDVDWIVTPAKSLNAGTQDWARGQSAVL